MYLGKFGLVEPEILNRKLFKTFFVLWMVICVQVPICLVINQWQAIAQLSVDA